MAAVVVHYIMVIPLSQVHTRWAAIEMVNTINECRSKIARNRVLNSKTLFLAIFDRCSSVVKSGFQLPPIWCEVTVFAVLNISILKVVSTTFDTGRLISTKLYSSDQW